MPQIRSTKAKLKPIRILEIVVNTWQQPVYFVGFIGLYLLMVDLRPNFEFQGFGNVLKSHVYCMKTVKKSSISILKSVKMLKISWIWHSHYLFPQFSSENCRKMRIKCQCINNAAISWWSYVIRLYRDLNVPGGGDADNERRVRREIANSNERRRMQSINAGFQSLRTLLPHHEGEKLSKVSIEFLFVKSQQLLSKPVVTTLISRV